MSIPRPEVSVIMCAHNPRRDILRMVLESLQRQTLDRARWEFVVVDNNSNPALSAEALNRGFSLPMRVVREPEPGLTPARRRGALESRGDLLVLVDDDNVLDPNYLQAALDIANAHPRLGAFGGATRPLLEAKHLRHWQEKLLPYLGVRDYGKNEITSGEDKWGEWEPIGAGMVVRRDVALKFIEFVQTVPLATTLDRSGKGLLSGGDSLIARAAYRLGYQCSYQPRLTLDHYIKKQRVRTSYLWRLLYGHGRSFVILNTVLGKPSVPITLRDVLSRVSYRYFKDGTSGLICWAWDIGYFVEARAAAHRQAGRQNLTSNG